MRISTGSIVAAFLSAAILAACGGGNNGVSSTTPMSVAPQIGAPQSVATHSAWQRSESSFGRQTRPISAVVAHHYNFKGGTDGEEPEAGLINVNGTLYGTTSTGGGGGCGSLGCGTVFEIMTSGTETVLYSFKGGTDGAYPEAGLLNVNGTLYGTTRNGGGSGCSSSRGCGTVFSITMSGEETVLHSFGGSGDGEYPEAGLINVNGTLYGTTTGGGASSNGTVFSITPPGSGTVLYSFKGGKDGEGPGDLIAVKGTLYGTTSGGGSGLCNGGCGTVYKITTAGTETVLYRFFKHFGTDGRNPRGPLDVNGTLYGTTSYGDGTVFKITTSGTKYKSLYSFKGGTDGAYPEAGLINVNGTLYGTTEFGGGFGCHNVDYCGTIFKVTTSGTEAVLYSFKGKSNGAWPLAGLLDVKGTLYGTTEFGGTNDDGTVFWLSGF